MFKETKKLRNEVEIPVLALGTWFIDDDKAADAVRSAEFHSCASVLIFSLA